MRYVCVSESVSRLRFVVWVHLAGNSSVAADADGMLLAVLMMSQGQGQSRAMNVPHATVRAA
jgi:hypothetical protein